MEYTFEIGPSEQLSRLAKMKSLPDPNGQRLEVSADNAELGSLMVVERLLGEFVKPRGPITAKEAKRMFVRCLGHKTEPKPVRAAPTAFLGRPVLATVEYRTQLELSWYVITQGECYFEVHHAPSPARVGIGCSLEEAISVARCDAANIGGGTGYHNHD